MPYKYTTNLQKQYRKRGTGEEKTNRHRRTTNFLRFLSLSREHIYRGMKRKSKEREERAG